MNDKGSITLLYTLMIAVAVIILAMGLAPAVKSFVDNSRNTTTDTQVGLDCSNTSISDFDQATCVSVDLTTPFFLGGLIALAIAILAARLVIQ